MSDLYKFFIISEPRKKLSYYDDEELFADDEAIVEEKPFSWDNLNSKALLPTPESAEKTTDFPLIPTAEACK